MYEPRSRTIVPLLLLIAVAAMLLCPSTDASPSADISASIVPDDEGACLVLSSDGAIPSGTVIVDYTYTVTRTIGGHEVSGATSDEFEQSYASDGSSHASIRLDFQGEASEHYDSITGAGATFVAGSGTWTAVSIPLSLPGIGETTYRFDTSSGERTVVITAADGLTATARESGGGIVCALHGAGLGGESPLRALQWEPLAEDKVALVRGWLKEVGGKIPSPRTETA